VILWTRNIKSSQGLASYLSTPNAGNKGANSNCVKILGLNQFDVYAVFLSGLLKKGNMPVFSLKNHKTIFQAAGVRLAVKARTGLLAVHIAALSRRCLNAC
jgi:hypothetical protein